MPVEIDFIFLIRAVKDNENVIVHHHLKDKDVITYRSRFLDINQRKKFIIIHMPTTDKENYKPLVPKDKISVHFRESGFRFLIETEVLEKFDYQLNPTKKIEALKIKLPEQLLDGNRRNFIRVSVPLDQPIKLNYMVVKNDEDPKPIFTQEEDAKFFDALMIDISEGGLAIRNKEEVTIQKSDRLFMWFQLEGETPQEIKLEGVVRNTRKMEDAEGNIWGIEFLPKRDTKYKNALQVITKYVMNRQREILALIKRER